MNKARLIKPNKLTIFVIALIALTLVCGMLFAAFNANKSVVANAASPTIANFNVTTTAGTDGVAFPTKYFEVSTLDTYDLPIGGYTSNGNNATNATADYFGNLFPSSGDNGGRNTGVNGDGVGWDQSAVYGGEFYTNIKLSGGLASIAELGALKVTISCTVASRYHYSRNDANRAGFLAVLGMSYTGDVQYALLSGETIPYGNGGMNGADFAYASKGQDQSGDLFTQDASATNGTYVSQDVSWTQTIAESRNIGNGGIRLHFFLASDQKSGCALSNVKVRFELATSFSGSGSSSSPYLITSARDLQLLSGVTAADAGYANAYYRQTANINLSSISDFTPIGVSPAIGPNPSGGSAFTGTYDGNGYFISNLTINSGTEYGQALFGYNTGTIRGVTLRGGSVVGEYYVGGIVGLNRGNVIDCVNYECAISGRGATGGIVGVNYGGTIQYCLNWGTVSSHSGKLSYQAAGQSKSDGSQYGGIAGLLTAGTITECANYANVSISSRHAGGIVGWAETGTTISYCINGGAITSSGDRAATISCMNYTGNITYTYNFGSANSAYDSSNTFANYGTPAGTSSAFTNCYDNSANAIANYASITNYISDTAYNQGAPYLRNTRYTDFVAPVYNERGLVNGTVSSSHNPNGTAISSWTEFLNVFRNSSSAHTVTGDYYLTNDIIATNGWYPLAASSSTSESGTLGEVTFSGIFDGNGHTITFNPISSGTRVTSNIRLNTGFIVDVLSGTIKNLNVIFDSTTNYIGTSNYISNYASFGGVVGWMKESSSLYNCSITYKNGATFVYRAIEGEYNGFGGVVGGVTGTPTISDCTLLIEANATIKNELQSAFDWGNVGGFVGIVKLDSAHTLFKRVSLHGSGTITATGGAGNHANGFIGEAKSSGSIVAEDLVFGFYGTISASDSHTNISNSAMTANKLYWFDNVDSYANLQSFNNSGSLSNVGGLTGATHIRIYKTMIANNDGGLTLNSSNAYCDRLYFDPNDENKLVLKGRFSATINDDDYVIGHVGYNNDQKIFTGANGSVDGLIFVGTKKEIGAGKDVLFEINKSLPTSNLYGNIRVGGVGTVNVQNTTFNYSADNEMDDIVASIRNASSSITPNTSATPNDTLANGGIGTWYGTSNRANSFTNASVRIYDANGNVVYESWNIAHINSRLQAGTYKAELVTSLNEFGVSFVYCKTVSVNYNSFSTANPFYVCLSNNYITFTVNPVAITVAPTETSKTYGDADPAFSAYSVTSGALVSGDSLSGSFQRVAGENVGNYAFNLGSIANSNYAISLQETSFTINKRAVTVTVDDKSAIYGEEDKPLTISDSNYQLVMGDTIAVITASLSRVAGTDVGTYTITANSLEAQNYVVTALNTGTYTIFKKDVQVIIDNKNTPYGTAIAPLTISVEDGTLEYDDTISDLGITLQKEEGSVVGNYDITIASHISTNYNVTNLDALGTYTITKKVITITIDNKSAVYGESDKALTISDSNNQLEYGDDISVITAVLVREEGNVVGTYDITATSLTADNYEVSAENVGTYTITKKPIAITIDDKNSIYGSELVELTISVEEGTLEYSDDVTALGITLQKAEGLIAKDYAITLSAYASENYEITSVSEGTYTINKKDVSVNYVVQKTKAYDGTELSSATLTGFVGIVGDDEVGASFDVRFNSKNVKEANQISVSITLTGADCGNYNLTTNTATVTEGVSISKAVLTVSVISKTNNTELRYVYGDDVNADFALSYVGFGVGDDEDVVFGEEKPVAQMPFVNVDGNENASGLVGATINAGKALTPVYEKELDNYILDLKSIRVYVDRKELIVTYVGESIVFGQNPAGSISYSGFVVGEDESDLVREPSVSFASLTKAYGFIVPGTYTELIPAGGESANYQFSYVNGTLNVAKKDVTAVYTNSIIYGDEPEVSFNNIVVTGLVAGDSTASLTIVSNDLAKYVNTGKYNLVAGDIVIESDNYNVSVTGEYEISLASISLSIEVDGALTYGMDVESKLSISYSGFKRGETVAIFGEDQPTISPITKNANGLVDAGEYTLNTIYDSALQNYQVGSATKTIKVEKANLSIAYGGKSVVYDRTNQTPEGAAISVNGFVGGETIDGYAVGENLYSGIEIQSYSYSGSIVVTTQNVRVILSAEQISRLANYNLSYVTGIFEITAREVKIALNDQTSVYNGAEPTIAQTEWQVADDSPYSWIESDKLNIKLTKEAGVDKGDYAISATYENANYNLTFTPATYSITARKVKINLLGQSADYTGTEPTVAQGKWEYAEDTAYELLEGASTNFNLTKVSGVNAGSYEISGSYNDDNYEVSFTSATYVINKIELSVSIELNIANKTVKVSELLNLVGSNFTITYTGFVNGESDTNDVITTRVAVDLDAIKLLELGNHTIPYVEGQATNYTFNYVAGEIIVKADLIVITPENYTFENATFTYDGSAKVIAFTWDEKPDHVTITHEYQKGGVVVDEMKDAGAYVVIARLSTTDPNSTIADEFKEVSRTLTINKAVVTVTFQVENLSRVYDGTTAITIPNQPEVEGMVGDEALSFNLSANFTGENAKNVGINKAIALVSTEPTYLNGAKEENYDITFVGEDTLTANVTKKALEVDYTIEQSKIYDNSIVAEVTFVAFVGLVGSDDVNAVLSASYNDKNVESANEITVSIGVEGQDALNYELSEVEEAFAGTITAKAVKVTFSALALSKVYDGEINVTLKEQPAVDGLIDGDAISFNLSAKFENANVGINKAITLDDVTPTALGETKLTNYAFEILGADILTANITPKSVSVTLKDQHSIYGQEIVVNQGTEWYVINSEIVEDDDLQIKITREGTSPNAGRYVLRGVAYNANYNVNVTNAYYIIDRAETEIYFNEMVKEVEYTGSDIFITPAQFYVYTNRENNTANIVYPTTVLREVGEYTVTFTVTEQTPDNYLPITATVTINVVRATPTVNFTAILEKEWRYNGSEQHVTGATHTNTDAGVEVSYSGNVFTDVPENGELTITVSLSETQNYKAVSATCVVTILKGNYDVSTVQFENGTYDYSGEERYLEVVGLPDGITVTYTMGEIAQSTPIMVKNAGIYSIRAIYSYDERNYNKPVIVDTALLTINRINITVELENQFGYYGEEPTFNPEGIKVIAGNFIEGDVVDLDLKLVEKESYPIGSYDVVSSATATGNYNVVIATGKYTILARPVTFRINDTGSQYGDEDAPLSYELDASSPYSLIEGDEFSVTLVREEGSLPKEGGYAITGAIFNPNYETTIIPGRYTVAPRAISIIVYDQEGTSASQLSKKEYRVVRTKGQGSAILRGDDLKIQVVAKEEIGSTPGEYVLTASYNEELKDLYEVKIVEAKFILRLATRITVSNKINSKLYDGVPYVFDIIVSSGATPQVTVDGIYVENAFTETGIYNITIIAPVIGDYAEPEPYRFTLEIRPVELIAEQGGVLFSLTKEGGFGADEILDVHQTQELVLSGENYANEIASAYSIYILKGEERIPLDVYAKNERVTLKVKLTEELQQIGVSTWFMDKDSNVLHTIHEPDENGFVEVEMENGMHVLFVAEREEAMPLLIIGCAMGLAFIILFLFYLFRKKAI